MIVLLSEDFEASRQKLEHKIVKLLHLNNNNNNSSNNDLQQNKIKHHHKMEVRPLLVVR